MKSPEAYFSAQTRKHWSQGREEQGGDGNVDDDFDGKLALGVHEGVVKRERVSAIILRPQYPARRC